MAVPGACLIFPGSTSSRVSVLEVPYNLIVAPEKGFAERRPCVRRRCALREERLFHVSRWLLALALVFIPLSIVVLISVVFAYNYPDRQWTRYLLLFSWISAGVSVIVGLVNLVGLSLSGEEGSPDEAEGETPGEEDFMITPPSSGMNSGGRGPSRGGGFSQEGLLLAQAFTLAVGVALYVAFLCWMLLPGIKIQMG